MPPENRLVSLLARENGISEQTLYTWRKNLQSQGVSVPGNGKNAEQWSSQDKFGVVLETARLNEAELAEYCRLKGLFMEQIAQWRLACQEANMLWSSNCGHNDRFACCHFPFVDGGRQVAQC